MLCADINNMLYGTHKVAAICCSSMPTCSTQTFAQTYLSDALYCADLSAMMTATSGYCSYDDGGNDYQASQQLTMSVVPIFQQHCYGTGGNHVLAYARTRSITCCTNPQCQLPTDGNRASAQYGTIYAQQTNTFTCQTGYGFQHDPAKTSATFRCDGHTQTYTNYGGCQTLPCPALVASGALASYDFSAITDTKYVNDVVSVVCATGFTMTPQTANKLRCNVNRQWEPVDLNIGLGSCSPYTLGAVSIDVGVGVSSQYTVQFSIVPPSSPTVAYDFQWLPVFPNFAADLLAGPMSGVLAPNSITAFPAVAAGSDGTITLTIALDTQSMIEGIIGDVAIMPVDGSNSRGVPTIQRVQTSCACSIGAAATEEAAAANRVATQDSDFMGPYVMYGIPIHIGISQTLDAANSLQYSFLGNSSVRAATRAACMRRARTHCGLSE